MVSSLLQAHQRLQGSLSVAVNAIMSVLTGSTCSSFRNTCLQALEVSRWGWGQQTMLSGALQHAYNPYSARRNTFSASLLSASFECFQKYLLGLERWPSS